MKVFGRRPWSFSSAGRFPPGGCCQRRRRPRSRRRRPSGAACPSTIPYQPTPMTPIFSVRDSAAPNTGRAKAAVAAVAAVLRNSRRVALLMTQSPFQDADFQDAEIQCRKAIHGETVCQGPAAPRRKFTKSPVSWVLHRNRIRATNGSPGFSASRCSAGSSLNADSNNPHAENQLPRRLMRIGAKVFSAEGLRWDLRRGLARRRGATSSQPPLRPRRLAALCNVFSDEELPMDDASGQKKSPRKGCVPGGQRTRYFSGSDWTLRARSPRRRYVRSEGLTSLQASGRFAARRSLLARPPRAGPSTWIGFSFAHERLSVGVLAVR